MLIRAPSSLHYPITITSLLVSPKQSVQRSDRLFTYTYYSNVTITNEFGEEVTERRSYPADFRAENDGSVVKWKIEKGDVIEGPGGVVLLDFDEPCRHEIQFGGLCANCGKLMTDVDYLTTQRNDTRATINMTHGNMELKVSENEAQRAGAATAQRLLFNKKLSLVVDLDQTIIHAVCDPTVADWQKDPNNPNYEAVKDVQAFELNEDVFNGRTCSYYIKQRPGLEKFLDDMSKLYELHIYTMGTRSYAENVAKIIDPKGKIFGDRILSRDESGSLTAKSLHRLFPVDTKMVVIIDDRGDVWNWSPNLVRVRAYSFYVGIGDINSSFLVKRPDEAPPPPPPPPVVPVASEETKTDEVKTATPPKDTEPTATIEEQLLAMAGGNDPSLLEEQSHKQQEEITAQLEERPLLKEQNKLDLDEAEKEREQENGTTQHVEHHRIPLLNNDDKELRFLTQNLRSIHESFYKTYEQELRNAKAAGRVGQLKGERKTRLIDNLELVPDIKVIVPMMKEQVLAGVHICFTGLIPQGLDHERSDVGQWARSFGAKVNPNLTKSTTHVIADKDRRTSKVRQAAKHSHIKIVDRHWLLECFSRWLRIDEDDYLIPVEDDHRRASSLPVENGDDNISLSDADERPSHIVVEEVLPDDDEVPDPESPIEALVGNIEWNDFDKELDEFMGSDDTETEDSEAEESDSSSQKSKPASQNGTSQKRKSSALGEEEETAGSRLEMRKKRAFGRTTSLTVVESANVAAEAAEKTKLSRRESKQEEEDEETERDMMAAFDEFEDILEGKGDG